MIEDGIEFTDLAEINTLDLNKLPPDDDSTELWYWMEFIKTDDEEVLDMLATRSPQMRKAVGVLKELSADEQTRMLYEKHEMARRDFRSERGKRRGHCKQGFAYRRTGSATCEIQGHLT